MNHLSATEMAAAANGGGTTPQALVMLAWAAVGIPMAWGVYKTLLNVGKFFN